MPKPKRYDYLLMDLDGTITDSKEGLVEALEYGLTQIGFTNYTAEQIESFIGPPLRPALMREYGFDEQTAEQVIDGVRALLPTVGVTKNKIYPGVVDFLEWGRADGRKLIVATSKNSRITRGALAHLGLDGYFDMIVGKTEAGGLGEKVRVIQYVLDNFDGIETDRCVMIGDRKYDIEGAREVGMDNIGILYGYGERAELEAAGADHICSDLYAVRRLIEEMGR